MWMLLHGFTGSPASWDAVIREAAFDREPLRPWLCGHGGAWRHERTDSFAAEAARLADQAASMKTPRFLAGYSLGARVALAMLASYPDRFDGALLIGVHPGLTEDTERRARRALDSERADGLRARGVADFVSRWESEPMFESQRSLPASLLQRQREIRLSHDPEGLAHSLDVLGLAAMPSYRGALATTDVPVRLMAGARDAKFSRIMVELSGSNPRVEGRSVEDAGHNLLLEAPREVAAELERLERAACGEVRA